ncbi:MAG: hypothetical protein EP330_17150 [Deltaproteobacteria bacterium]|nr:MAG: hypothetical protein EP330_17150 [Deltaproteobacteria bacterium]
MPSLRTRCRRTSTRRLPWRLPRRLPRRSTPTALPRPRKHPSPCASASGPSACPRHPRGPCTRAVTT